jgi:hypothetical protein
MLSPCSGSINLRSGTCERVHNNFKSLLCIFNIFDGRNAEIHVRAWIDFKFNLSAIIANKNTIWGF